MTNEEAVSWLNKLNLWDIDWQARLQDILNKTDAKTGAADLQMYDRLWSDRAQVREELKKFSPAPPL